MPFTSTLDPVIFQVGPLAVRWYGVAYLLAFLFGWWWLRRAAEKGELKLTNKQIDDLIFWIIVGVVAGARLGYILFWNPSYYFQQPFKIIAVWEGGMAFHGGLIGILVAGWWFCRKHKLSFLHLADILCIPAAFGLALGRVANFINAELYGPVTNVSWCVNFPDVEGCRHPYQIYSALKRTIVGFALLWLAQAKQYKDGFIFWLFLLFMGIGRFILDFWRVDTAYWVGLSTGQWLSAILAIVAVIALWKNHRRDITG